LDLQEEIQRADSRCRLWVDLLKKSIFLMDKIFQRRWCVRWKIIGGERREVLSPRPFFVFQQYPVKSVALSALQRLPLDPENPTYRCVALSDAKRQKQTDAPQKLSSAR
jgi:hypothetical protein